jgi:hypothetical protein
MDSTLIPPEGLTELQQQLFIAINTLITVLMPLFIKLVDQVGFLKKVPTNILCGVFTAILGIIVWRFTAPTMPIIELIGVMTAMFTGSTLIASAGGKKLKPNK